jgi:hypothetical protein
MTSLRL